MLEKLHVISIKENTLYIQTQLVPTRPWNGGRQAFLRLLNYHPKGRRRPGRPLKRLLDDVNVETETGHPSLNSRWNVMMMAIKSIGTMNLSKLYDSVNINTEHNTAALWELGLLSQYSVWLQTAGPSDRALIPDRGKGPTNQKAN
jgi:hypothetical protein